MKKAVINIILQAEKYIYRLTGYRLPAIRVYYRRQALQNQCRLNTEHGNGPYFGILIQYYKNY